MKRLLGARARAAGDCGGRVAGARHACVRAPTVAHGPGAAPPGQAARASALPLDWHWRWWHRLRRAPEPAAAAQGAPFPQGSPSRKREQPPLPPQ